MNEKETFIDNMKNKLYEYEIEKIKRQENLPIYQEFIK
jgi:hypothetical protein